MKNIINRNDEGDLNLNSTKKRVVFIFAVLFWFVGIISCFVTLIFIPYWIFTGKDMFKELFDF